MHSHEHFLVTYNLQQLVDFALCSHKTLFILGFFEQLVFKKPLDPQNSFLLTFFCRPPVFVYRFLWGGAGFIFESS